MTKILPDRVIWHATKERPKTRYLLRGFVELGIKITTNNSLVDRFRPSRNPRGLYVYPIGLVFGQKLAIVFLDINTIPKMFFNKFEGLAKRNKMMFYFKTHLEKRNAHRAIVAPNSPSDPEQFLKYLDHTRSVKDQKNYQHDFFFRGWHDDDGTRMKCVRRALRRKKSGDWRVDAGLMPFKHHTTVPKELLTKRLDYLPHLRSQCMSKLSLALPGGRALPYCSFRHVELWGMGCAMLTVEPNAVLPGDPAGTYIPFRRDMADFHQVVDYYLKNDEERERIALKGREYFDTWLTPEANAEWIIEHVHERIMK